MPDAHALFGELNPAQRRVVDDLLGLRQPRPPVEGDAGRRWGERLEDRLAGATTLLPPGADLFLGKSKLDALDCDGRFLDQRDQPFRWSVSILRGRLAHTAIELDQHGGRERRVADVVTGAWEKLATGRGGEGEFLETLGGVDADALRGQAADTVREFRDCFPLLPAWVDVRAELRFRIPLCGGVITLQGQPDLVVGRAQHAGQRRLLLLDLKTGGRYPPQHRADMRFYALLATLKYGVPPFRVATYYLDEAGWDAEDVDDDVLEAAVRTVEDKARRAARLEFDPPPEHELHLVAGSACNWCGRAPGCPARIEWSNGAGAGVG